MKADKTDKLLNRVKNAGLIAILVLLVCQTVTADAAIKWKQTKGKHFIVYSTNSNVPAKEIIRKSEEYLKKITADLNYTNHSKFWTWEKRVKIYVYPSQQHYIFYTRLPFWSAAVAVYEEEGDEKKMITFKQNKLIDSILPHEITHMVLNDYMGKDNVPLWLHEGIAQYQEKYRDKKEIKNKKLLTRHSNRKELFSLENLDSFFSKKTAYGSTHPGAEEISRDETVNLFYARSLDLVGFMIREFGQRNFSRFCKQLRDKKDYDGALRFSYPTSVRSVEKLESLWQQSLSD